MRAGNLQSSGTKSCGCLRKENSKAQAIHVHKQNIKPDAARNRVLSNYRAGAKERNLNFDLSSSEFDELIFAKCFYCDSDPTNKSTAQSGNSIRYNGIDRLDSKVGYVAENCVPCCNICNMMKKTMNLCDFVLQCKKIAETISSTDVLTTVPSTCTIESIGEP